jgi:site-specific DNA-adenine methylase
MKVTKLKAPFGWVGGKSKLAKDIVSLFPQHTTYVEVFGGALSVLYAKERSKVEVVNDINSELNKRATYKDVAKALGIPYNRLRQQIHKNTIPFEEILIFCFKRKISINYLFFNQLPETLIKDTDQLITLRYNSVLGSLGHGLINYELEPVDIVLDKYLLDFIEGS